MFVTPAYGEDAAPAAGTEAGTQAGTTVPAEAAHEGGTFPPFNPATFPSQILWLAITFGLFYLFLKRVIVPRLGNILDGRANRIQQDLDQAARLKEEADAAVAAYEQALAEAKTRANGIGQQARDAAKAEAEAARKEIEAGLEAKLADAEKRISAIRDGAMQDVGAIAAGTASAIIERLVGKPTDAEVAAAVKAVG